MIGHFQLKQASHRSPLKLIVGAASSRQSGWIATNKINLNLLVLRDWECYFTVNSIDAILAEHVWEHLELSEAYLAAQHCFQYLKPDGYLRVAVPDGLHPNPAYIDWVKPGGQGDGSDDHRVLYTYRTFSQVFQSAGFEVELLEYFDEQGGFHAKTWEAEAGLISRSQRYDDRNHHGQLNYTSIILDAWKRSG